MEILLLAVSVSNSYFRTDNEICPSMEELSSRENKTE
jgi:hypothetical protein